MKKKKENKFLKIFNLFNLFLFLIIALGIFLRAKCFIANPSLWHDDCALAWNIKFKSYLDCFGILRFLQVVPPLFVISTKALIDLFNVKNNVLMCDMTMVAIPFAASILSIFVFALISKDVFTKKITQIAAVFLFAINFVFIHYACQLRQYSTDVLMVLLVILFFLKINPEKLGKKSLISYGIFIALSIWFSFVTIFFWAAGFLVLLIKRKGINNVGWLILPLFLSLFLYAKLYLFGTFSHNSGSMSEYWAMGFIKQDFSNFVTVFMQNIMFFFSSTIYFAYAETALVILGLITFLTQEKKDFLYIAILSFAFLIVASVFQFYPFFGRVILFIIPVFIVLVAKPLDFVDVNKKFLSFILIALYLAIAIPQGILVTKYAMLKTYSKGENPREMMGIIAKNIKKGDKIFITEDSNTEYFYYSSFYKFKNQVIYNQYNNNADKYVGALKALPSGKYWIYLPYDTSANKTTNRKIVMWSKKHANILKYNQKGQSVLIYIKK